MQTVTCKRCSYTWNYKGELYNAICPRCRKLNILIKVKTPEEVKA